jgi:hypothetical protein
VVGAFFVYLIDDEYDLFRHFGEALVELCLALGLLLVPVRRQRVSVFYLPLGVVVPERNQGVAGPIDQRIGSVDHIGSYISHVLDGVPRSHAVRLGRVEGGVRKDVQSRLTIRE